MKIITTGEGGVATCNDKSLANNMRLFRGHGINKEINPSKEPWMYEQLVLGYNYRMSDISAALGVSQLNKLDKFISLRKKVYSKEVGSGAQRYFQHT